MPLFLYFSLNLRTPRSECKEWNIKIYDLNLTKVKSADISRVNTIASISGTPTTVFYKNGEEETLKISDTLTLLSTGGDIK